MTITFLFALGSLRKNVAFVSLSIFFALAFKYLGATKLSGQMDLGGKNSWSAML